MSYVNISNIIVENNPTSFLNPFKFTVTFECLQPIREEIEWKVIYVGSPRDESYDQTLDSFSIGPFDEAGTMQFNIESTAPDYSKIPQEDIFGVAAIIHSVSYQKQEFFRVGYFVYNNYEDPQLLENPWPIQADKIIRSILADKPRIIRTSIDWESQCSEKVKAMTEIFMESSRATGNDNVIQFKGMFSDVGANNGQQQNNEFNGFNWNNNGNNNNQYSFPSGKENFSEDNGLQQYNSGCFNQQGLNVSQPGCFAQNEEMNLRNNHFGNGFY